MYFTDRGLEELATRHDLDNPEHLRIAREFDAEIERAAANPTLRLWRSVAQGSSRSSKVRSSRPLSVCFSGLNSLR